MSIYLRVSVTIFLRFFSAKERLFHFIMDRAGVEREEMKIVFFVLFQFLFFFHLYINGVLKYYLCFSMNCNWQLINSITLLRREGVLIHRLSQRRIRLSFWQLIKTKPTRKAPRGGRRKRGLYLMPIRLPIRRQVLRLIAKCRKDRSGDQSSISQILQ